MTRLLAVTLVLMACAPPAQPARPGPCDNVPMVTWGSFGQGFLTENCQGCHASTALDRHGAPPAVFFDTVDSAWSWAPNILDRAGADPPTMPPLGGTDPDDRTRLHWWLECAEPGT